MSRRTLSLVLIVSAGMLCPMDALAIRASSAQAPPPSCSKLLAPGTRVRLTLSDGSEIRGEISRVDEDGLGLTDADSLREPSYIGKARIAAMRIEQPRFPRLGSTLSGFAVGTVAGLLLEITDEPDGRDDGGVAPLPGVLGRSPTVALGAITGLAIGTVIPLFHPGEQDVECGWFKPNETGSISTPWHLPPGASHFRFGLSARASRGYTNFDLIQSAGFRYGGGLHVEWRPNPRFAARSGALWVPGKYEFVSVIPEVDESLLRLNYVAVPLTALYRPLRSLPISLTAGCEFGRLVEAQLSTTFDDNDSAEERDLTNNGNDWDLSLTGGLVVPLRMFEIGVYYARGLRDTEVVPDLKTRAVTLSWSLWLG